MSQITRCPACMTQFRVVADQLRISQGWVRCGQCNEVFDAAENLQAPVLPEARADASLHAAALPSLPTAAPVLDIPEPVVPAFLAAGQPAPVMPLVAPSRAPVTLPEPVPEPEQAQAQEPDSPQSVPLEWSHPGLAGGYELPSADPGDEEMPGVLEADAPGLAASSTPSDGDAPTGGGASDHLHPAPVASLSENPWAIAASEPVVVQNALAADGAGRGLSAPGHAPQDDDVAAAVEMPDVSFVRHARRQAFWRKPMVRLLLCLVTGLLCAGLVLQVVVHERNRIAAMDARTRPWLLQLCAPLQCTLAPQRQILDLVIDSSSFSKGRGDGYQLAFTLKNQATVALETPAVELTLTDAQDQPVLRRVLLPADMAAPAQLVAGGNWGAQVSVVVTTGGNRVAGYRLLAFYP